MSTKSAAELEADETAQNRAQWEQFSFQDETAECDCDGFSGFPCWEWVQAGRKTLPN